MNFLMDRFPLYTSWMSKASNSTVGMSLSPEQVSELAREMFRMFEFAEALSYDELTGMLVRKLFFYELTQAVKPYVSALFRGNKVDASQVICLVGDVAMLSYANSKGHLVGDRLLRSISAILSGVESLTCFGRAGGDELVAFVRGSDLVTVKDQVRVAQLKIAAVKHHQLDAGISTLDDVKQLLAIKDASGKSLVSPSEMRTKTKFVVQALFSIAMERAQIEKIAFRLAFLAEMLLNNKEFFDEVKPHAVKSAGGVTMVSLRSLAGKLARGYDIWTECYERAVKVRQKEMSGTPFQKAVFEIAEKGFH